MGVPKFFRWLSERYPCLSEVVTEHKIPEFDNLYLDMNGIIHHCTHREDNNIHFRMSEEEMFKKVKDYVDFIFHMVKPKKVFFMAIDGVAPRAKMNQQRSRRFRSAKEAETQEAEALRNGEELPNESRFDSNCITPGTLFMARLQAALTEFVERKVADDPLWRGIRVILSGHQTPGEGEHKIMEFIRYERSRPDYDHDTRHCLYGLDADLIMLGLASHQAHFSLLREEVLFGESSPDAIKFFLLHLSLLRDYIDIEFHSLRSDLKFRYDIERVIDDWVLLGFLVGNDFLPHLPDLHIHSEALPLLWNTYKEVLPKLDGYLQYNGKIALERMQTYFSDLSQLCDETRRRGELMAPDLEGLGDAQIPDSNDEASRIQEDEDEKKRKQEYYQGKMGLLYDEAEQRRQTQEYVRGLQWVLHYYYTGVPSWGWFFPQHYAPCVSDIRDFTNLDFQFDLGQPFSPFQQLMAVLPAASRILLPDCLQPLMDSPDSTIRKFYPPEFKTDLNGKEEDWEAVVLLPFIDEAELLDAMQPHLAKLTEDERSRNDIKPHLLFEYDPVARRTRVTEIEPFGFRVEHNQRDERDAADLACSVPRSAHMPGFPVLRGLLFTTKLKKSGVRVFKHDSRGENIVITLTDCEYDEARAQKAATALLNRRVLANWPHLTDVLAESVSTATKRYTLGPDGGVSDKELTKQESKLVSQFWKRCKTDAKRRYGIFISGATPCVLEARTRVIEFGPDGTSRLLRWSEDSQKFILQLCLPEPAPEPLAPINV